MLILLLLITGLILWSLRLMLFAFRRQDYSLLFAGTLVAMSAAGIVIVYSLMNGCMGYLSAGSVDDSSVLESVASIEEQDAANAQYLGGSFWVEEIPNRF
jgi:cytochrome b subunit of formate dehydrogenase